MPSFAVRLSTDWKQSPGAPHARRGFFLLATVESELRRLTERPAN
jgi:hypothetical protein